VVEWVNVKAAVEVTKRLNDFVKLFDHVLANSSKLVRAIDGWMSFDFILASFDVSDMYNSIEQEDCILRISMLAEEHSWWTKDKELWWQSTMTLIRFVFETSYVDFGGHVYKQKRGLPMGSPLSPVLANLYMAWLEVQVMDTLTACGARYYHYLDDIFMIYPCDNKPYSDVNKYRVENELADFVGLLTRFSDDSIKFERTGTAHNPGQYVEYLDLKICIDLNTKAYRNKRLRIEIFDKPTNLHIYTDPSTFYPFHYVYN
jgi:hypothetical protein